MGRDGIGPIGLEKNVGEEELIPNRIGKIPKLHIEDDEAGRKKREKKGRRRRDRNPEKKKKVKVKKKRYREKEKGKAKQTGGQEVEGLKKRERKKGRGRRDIFGDHVFFYVCVSVAIL